MALVVWQGRGRLYVLMLSVRVILMVNMGLPSPDFDPTKLCRLYCIPYSILYSSHADPTRPPIRYERGRPITHSVEYHIRRTHVLMVLL